MSKSRLDNETSSILGRRRNCKGSFVHAMQPIKPAAKLAPLVKSESLVISDDEKGDGDDGPSVDVACDSSSSSSSSSDSSSDEECAQPATVRRYKHARPSEQLGQVWYMHCKSTVLHLRKNDCPILACGRPVNARYERVSATALQNCDECRTCRRNM